MMPKICKLLPNEHPIVVIFGSDILNKLVERHERCLRRLWGVIIQHRPHLLRLYALHCQWLELCRLPERVYIQILIGRGLAGVFGQKLHILLFQ